MSPIVTEITKVIQSNVYKFIENVSRVHDIDIDEMVELWCKQEKMKPSDFNEFKTTMDDTVEKVVNGICNVKLDDDDVEDDDKLVSDEEEPSSVEANVLQKAKGKKRESSNNNPGLCTHIPSKGANKGKRCDKPYKGSGPYCGSHKNIGNGGGKGKA